MRIVDSDEVNTALHTVRDEGDIASKPVELSDYQGGFGFLRGCDGGGELGPVVTLPALDLRVFSQEIPRVAGEVP